MVGWEYDLECSGLNERGRECGGLVGSVVGSMEEERVFNALQGRKGGSWWARRKGEGRGLAAFRFWKVHLPFSRQNLFPDHNH